MGMKWWIILIGWLMFMCIFGWISTSKAGEKPRILPAKFNLERCLAGGLASGDSVTTVAIVCGGIYRVQVRQEFIKKAEKKGL